MHFEVRQVIAFTIQIYNKKMHTPLSSHHKLFHSQHSLFEVATTSPSYILKLRWCLSICPSVCLSRCRSWFQDLDGRIGPGLEIEVPRWKRRRTTTNGGRKHGVRPSVRLSIWTKIGQCLEDSSSHCPFHMFM